MKSNIVASLVLASAISSSQSAGIDDIVRKDTIIPAQEVKTNGPAIVGVQVVIHGKIHLLLLNPADAPLFPDSLAKSIGNIQPKVKLVVQNMIGAGKLPSGVIVGIQSFGTTTPVDIGEGRVGFLTASHVLQKEKSPNDVCITNKVIGDDIPKVGLPILKISSKELNGKLSYTQFPLYSHGKFMMVQIPSILRYEGIRQWVQGRFEFFQGGSSGGPVIVENPIKKGEYGIVSIFPGGVSATDGSWNIAEMPRNEVLSEVKREALVQSKKGGDYIVCR